MGKGTICSMQWWSARYGQLWPASYLRSSQNTRLRHCSAHSDLFITVSPLLFHSTIPTLFITVSSLLFHNTIPTLFITVSPVLFHFFHCWSQLRFSSSSATGSMPLFLFWFLNHSYIMGKVLHNAIH
jgi:hypothetical protein